MKGLRHEVRTLEIALTGQFCKDMVLKASGEVAEVDFGRRAMWARFRRSVSATPWWNCAKKEKISCLIEGQKDL